MPLGKRPDCGGARYAGLEVDQCQDLEQVVDCSNTCGFDFVVAPLVNCDQQTAAQSATPPKAPGLIRPPFPLEDVVVGSLHWSNKVVGRLSPWITCDTADSQKASLSAGQLSRELTWALHLGLQAVMLPRMHPENTARYAGVLHQALDALGSMSLWQPVPLFNDNSSSVPHGQSPALTGALTKGQTSMPDAPMGDITDVGGGGGGTMHDDVWHQWHMIRSLCEHHPQLGVVLEVGSDLPSDTQLERWYGEPVRVILLPTSVFLTNNKGYAVLSKAHQRLITRFMSQSVQVVLRDEQGLVHHPPPPPPPPEQPTTSTVSVLPDGHVTPTPSSTSRHPLAGYWEYLSYVFRKQPPLSEEEVLESEYRDFLQAPLQPLQDNLESSTYETFERDAAKYAAYEEAVYRALCDRVPDAEAATRVTVLMVVGAGRGPLVRASIAAAARAGRLLKVYAVEKNTNALISIQQLINREHWHHQVTLVGADMRHWQAPELADILVSELLGSFGDNELSPECLDGAQRFLKPDGISIPASYTSYLQPIATHKLWNDVKAYKELKHFETPFVVKLWRHAALGAVLPVFTFEHPNHDVHIDNTRYIRLTFDRTNLPAALCHGFAGYFDTLLYKGVTLSIHPDTHTPDMFSWFPIYFPLREPLVLPAGKEVEVSMWRCVGASKVWYEWAVVGGAAPTPIHNPGGRSYFVGL